MNTGKKLLIFSVLSLAVTCVTSFAYFEEDIAKEFMKQARQLANEYYGYFANAAESNTDEDWKKASDALESLRNSAQPNLVEKITDVSSLLFNSITGNTEEYNKVLSKRILITLAAIGMPDFRKVTDKYYASMEELSELLAIVDKRTNN